jgi:hypothetical protein
MERDPHHELNNPATDPDPTEWPDPYDKREDPRGPDKGHVPPGTESTSQPHPDQDIEATRTAGPKKRRKR